MRTFRQRVIITPASGLLLAGCENPAGGSSSDSEDPGDDGVSVSLGARSKSRLTKPIPWMTSIIRWVSPVCALSRVFQSLSTLGDVRSC